MDCKKMAVDQPEKGEAYANNREYPSTPRCDQFLDVVRDSGQLGQYCESNGKQGKSDELRVFPGYRGGNRTICQTRWRGFSLRRFWQSGLGRFPPN